MQNDWHLRVQKFIISMYVIKLYPNFIFLNTRTHIVPISKHQASTIPSPTSSSNLSSSHVCITQHHLHAQSHSNKIQFTLPNINPMYTLGQISSSKRPPKSPHHDSQPQRLDYPSMMTTTYTPLPQPPPTLPAMA